MAERIPGLVAQWVPEGIDPSPYNPGKRLVERSIDVLEYGRTYPYFTTAVKDDVGNGGLRHVYPKAGQQVFSNLAQLRAALSDSKALVCYPRSQTEPHIAGSVETVTLRYFEAIASRALVIGRAPQELIDLFGYNPAIEIDVSNLPGKAVVQALRDVERYQPLVERNYLRLLEVATWEVRAKEIIDLLEDAGYVVRQDE
ncbi:MULTISPECIES: glycosyltransferase [unclassified Thiocapsa]|uniref:glycosyltransferase n=1 Tax=unclassified Thiocapsa TaxID=2641286 RepID=UPI0035AF7DAE